MDPRPVDFDVTTLLQVLILALGIYVLLAFLRSTRGSGLVRGLGLMLIVGVYGLWGLSGRLGLEEVNYVLKGLLGFVFVILAIVFQPELRRGIVTLGENPLLGRLLRTQRKEVLAEVAAAAVAMAKKKQGALIAFERKTPLDVYVEGGAKLDAEANRYLLESIFHHGNVLHDGAVVIRGDRVVGAACLFPLTENIEISKSTGTRHRAALGLTEETDAVTVAVSEETGLISICKAGKMERRIPRAQLEEQLESRLGLGGDTSEEESEEDGDERAPFLLRLFTEHFGQKLAALVLAGLVFYGAHQDLRLHRDKDLAVVAVTQDPGRATPGQLTVVLREGWRLAPGQERSCRVRFEGTREELDALTQVGGIVRVTKAGAQDVPTIEWSPPLGTGVVLSWPNDTLELNVQGLAEQELTLTRDMLVVNTDALDPSYEAQLEAMAFVPSTVRVRGPELAMNRLELRFEDVVLGLQDTSSIDRFVSLSAALAGQGIELLDSVRVTVPVVLREEEFGTIEVPIVLWQWDQDADPHTFQPPGDPATFAIFGRGLFEGRLDQTERIRIRTFVEQHLRAFISVDGIDVGATGRVDWHGLRDWRALLTEQGLQLSPEADLRVELTSEREILLSNREEQ